MAAAQVIDISTVVEKQKISGFLLKLIVISWLVTFFDAFDITVIAYAAPYIAPGFKFTKLMMGHIFSAGLFGTIIGAFIFGYIGDRIGRRKATIIAACWFGLMTLALAYANSYNQFIVLRVLDGMATGGFLPLIWALNIEYSPKRFRSTMVTLNMLGYSTGTVLCGPIAIALIPHFGWRAVFYFGGIFSLVGTLLLVAFLPESIRFLTSKQLKPELVAKIVNKLSPASGVTPETQFVLGDEGGQGRKFNVSLLFKGELRFITPLLWIGYVCSSLTTFCISSWTPMIFEAMKFSRTDAAWAGSAQSCAGAIAALLLMRFTDRFGAISVSIMPMLATPILLIAAFGGLSHSAFFMFYPLVGFFVTGGHNGMHSIAGIFYPSAYRSNGTGIASAIAKIGATCGPLVGGAVLASGMQTQHLFGVLAISPAIMAVCVFFLGRVHRRILGREAMQAPSAEPVAATAGK